MFCSYFRMRAKFSTPRREIFCVHTVLMKKHNRRSRTYNYQIRRRRGNFIRRKKYCALDGCQLACVAEQILSYQCTEIIYRASFLKKLYSSYFTDDYKHVKPRWLGLKQQLLTFYMTLSLYVYIQYYSVLLSLTKQQRIKGKNNIEIFCILSFGLGTFTFSDFQSKC